MSAQTAGSPAPQDDAINDVDADETAPALVEEQPNRLLSQLAFWAMHVFVLAYVGVLLAAFSVQFLQGEFPCPLCMLQRYGMILASLGGLWIIMQARRGELTRSRYAQALGLSVLAALLGALVSVRQILLHILPGDPGYGSAVLGYHLYTWALITFYVVMTPVGLLLRLLGYDPMHRRMDKTVESYWIKREPVTDPGRYFRQF